MVRRISVPKAYKDAQARTSLDEAEVAQHQAALRSAEIALGYTNILAPIEGTVISRDVDIGQTVAVNSGGLPLFLIAPDLTLMRVGAKVSEHDIGKIKLGDKASFTVGSIPNHTFNGEVIQIRQSMRADAATSDVVISAPNPELLLKPEMHVDVRIVVDQGYDR